MKMRTNPKLYLFIFFILRPNLMWAEFVPEETARQVAVNHMNKSIRARALQRRQKESGDVQLEERGVVRITEEQISETFTATKDEIFVYYMFNFSPEGWAIISADDAAYPVIGYSENGFYDPNVSNQPPALTAWMDNVSAEIAEAVIGGLAGLPDTVDAWKQLSAAAPDFVPDLGADAMALSVTPLIQSTWGQGKWYQGYGLGLGCCIIAGCTESDGYNKYCPWEYTDSLHGCKYYCPTGCTATAMAQIMRYWQWPRVGQGSYGYDPPYACSHVCEGFDWREVDFSQQYYDWRDSSMPLNTASDAIAILMRDIGVAVEMNYTPSGSGAGLNKASNAYRTYFKYNANNPTSREYYSDPNWINKLKAELDASRPILYRGTPSPDVGGHAFVCDGYDLSGSFHFNWGWDGNYDGYFTLDDLTPGDHNYSYAQQAVFGIEPNSRPMEVYVDDDYSAGGGNDGHTWLFDAFNNFRYAMNIVHPGGTVYVAAGTYNEAIDLKGKALRLYGTGGPSVTTINGSGHYHVIQCVSGEDANTIIEGFTITGGNANGTEVEDQRGGGMYNYYSSPTVKNCIFQSNIATGLGGGMFNYGSQLKVTNCTFISNRGKWGAGICNTTSSHAQVTDCTFSNNTSDDDGGGMFNYSSSPEVTNCTFSSNSSLSSATSYNGGGGIYNDGGSPTITNCTFSINTANGNGGGIYNMGGSLLTITNCTFRKNIAMINNGGGIFNYYSNANVTNCRFIENEAEIYGGGMYNYKGSPAVDKCSFNQNTAGTNGGGMYNFESNPSLTNCTFHGNSAPSNNGGGMFNHLSSPTVTNSIFSGNSAAHAGGGIRNWQSSPTVTNCTFSGNSAGNGGGMLNENYSSPTIVNCILWDDTPNEIINVSSTTAVSYSNVQGGWEGEGNINVDPCFANPENGDYHLKSEASRWDPNSQTWIKDNVTSSSIDAGDPNSDWTAEYWPHGERINMGAYGGTPEASASLSKAGNAADLNLDGGSDYRDMKMLIDKWLYEAMLLAEDVSRDGIINSFDFSIFAYYFELSARHPNPADGASNVSTNVDLSWTAGRRATSHDVYFGTSNPPPFIQNQAATTYDPGLMAYSTEHYWRIDEVGDYGTMKGAVWSFTTCMAPP